MLPSPRHDLAQHLGIFCESVSQSISEDEEIKSYLLALSLFHFLNGTSSPFKRDVHAKDFEELIGCSAGLVQVKKTTAESKRYEFTVNLTIQFQEHAFFFLIEFSLSVKLLLSLAIVKDLTLPSGKEWPSYSSPKINKRVAIDLQP